MVLFLSFLCCACSLALTANDMVAYMTLPVSFPRFTATAAALAGVLIAALEYAPRRTKKKRRLPACLLAANAIAGIAAAVYWIFLMLK